MNEVDAPNFRMFLETPTKDKRRTTDTKRDGMARESIRVPNGDSSGTGLCHWNVGRSDECETCSSSLRLRCISAAGHRCNHPVCIGCIQWHRLCNGSPDDGCCRAVHINLQECEAHGPQGHDRSHEADSMFQKEIEMGPSLTPKKAKKEPPDKHMQEANNETGQETDRGRDRRVGCKCMMQPTLDCEDQK